MASPVDRYNVTDLVSPFDVRCGMESCMIPMRDGVKLHTVVYFPQKRRKKSPAVIVRSPYTRTNWFELPDSECLRRGIVYVLQACRGTGWSEGEFVPACRDSEMRDFADLMKWMKVQPWFSGRCAMMGASYPGWVQWCAARTGDPALAATAPQVAPVYSCTGSAVPGGGVRLSFTTHWCLSMHHRRTYGYSGVPDYEAMKIDWKLPVIDFDRNAGYPELPAVRKFFLSARTPGKELSAYRRDFPLIHAPALISGGWFDDFKHETVESFLRMKADSASPEARKFTRLVIGPWGHGGLLNPDWFGKKCDHRQLLRLRNRFLFGLLKNPKADPIPGTAAVQYYLLGANRWRESSVWPPPETVRRRMWLHSGGNANTNAGDGSLDWKKPVSDEPPDRYLSNPETPVLSNGGCHASLGFYDRSEQEQRADMLVYTSAPLKKSVAAAGRVNLHFTASCSTPDTDFFATLTLVTPDGRSMRLTSGMIRARFRQGPDRERPVKPNALLEYEIDLSHIAVEFRAGTSIRLEIHGQDFPAFDRNANTGNPVGTDTVMRTSVHTVFHDLLHPAYLEWDEFPGGEKSGMKP